LRQQPQRVGKGQDDMPLKKGKSAKTKKGVAYNIKQELKAGKKPRQAVAIAMRLAGKPKPKKKKK
jgi:hypothetical protein